MKKRILNTIAALVLAATAALAQVAPPFTVLSNNADIENKKLFVELSYAKPECGDYKATFRLANKDNKAGDPIEVDSFMNNPGTYETETTGKTMSLMRPQAGGYRLRFALPAGATAADSFEICVETYRMPFRCVGCGAGGSSPIFRTEDVSPNCPYKGADAIACRQRGNSTQLWEAWIQDARDCKVYRTVLMPDGRWWFAENLNYTKDLAYDTRATCNLYDMNYHTGALTIDGACAGNGLGLGQYWCRPAATGEVASSWGAAACDTYGALYTFNTAMARDGRNHVGKVRQTPINEESSAQGICPDGWLLPGFKDWSMMFNSVEVGCTDLASNTISVAPCNHNYYTGSGVNTSAWRGTEAGKHLRSTLTCPTLNAAGTDNSRVPCATATNPMWSLYLDDAQRKIPYSSYMGTDRFGFSALPHLNRATSAYNNSTLSNAYFWTSTSNTAQFTAAGNNAFMRGTSYEQKGAYVTYTDVQSAYAVRCVAPRQEIDEYCGYPNTENDLIACRERVGVGNYEAWIKDRRDGNIYRIVSMPDGRWWFAQELQFTNGMQMAPVLATNYATGYFYPTGTSVAVATPATLNAIATFGAQYNWYTMMLEDGVGTIAEADLRSVPYGQKSTVRGICPPGWFIPSTHDWGVMLNAVDNCPMGTNTGVAPCVHNPTVGGAWVAGAWATGTTAAMRLKVANPRGYNTHVFPSWTAGGGGDGTDFWGFSLYPTGYRGVSAAGGSNFANHDLRLTATAYSAANAVYRHTGRYTDNLSYTGGNVGKYEAAPVRCVGPNKQ